MGHQQRQYRWPHDKPRHDSERLSDRGRVGPLPDADHLGGVVGVGVDDAERADLVVVDARGGYHCVGATRREPVHAGELSVRAGTGKQHVVAEGDGEQVRVTQPICHGEQRCRIAITVTQVFRHGP